MRAWLSGKIFQFVRWYFVGKELMWIGMVDGHYLYRGSGRIISGRVEKRNKVPVGLTLFWLPDGLPEVSGLREAPLTDIHYNRDLRRWEYHEPL